MYIRQLHSERLRQLPHQHPSGFTLFVIVVLFVFTKYFLWHRALRENKNTQEKKKKARHPTLNPPPPYHRRDHSHPRHPHNPHHDYSHPKLRPHLGPPQHPHPYPPITPSPYEKSYPHRSEDAPSESEE
uniref:Uncharacterized protein n=1 Tax=Glossina pallidipes TaxID=7398 RepID=A0A1A9ZR89_GLOPL